MKKYLVLLVFTVMFSNICAEANIVKEREKIVILPFVNKSKIRKSSLNERLTALIEEKMVELSENDVINRSELKRILDEQKMIMLGLVEEGEAIKIGKIAGAQKAVAGTLLDLSEYKSQNGFVVEIVVDIKIVDIQSAKVFKTISLREVSEGQSGEIAKNGALNKLGNDFKRKMSGENVDTNRESEEFLKGVVIIKEIKRGWEIDGYYVMLPFKSKDYSFSEQFIKFKNKSGNYLNGVGVEFSREKLLLNFEYGTNGGCKLYKIGAGLKKKILDFDKAEVEVGLEGDLAFFEAEIGETIYNTEISSKTFPEGSKIYISKTLFGVTPFIKANTNITENLSLFVVGEYRVYQNIDDYNIEIESGGRESVKLEGFEGSVSLSGADLRAGIAYKF